MAGLGPVQDGAALLLRPLKALHQEWVTERISRLTTALGKFRAAPGALVRCFAGAIAVQATIVAFYVAAYMVVKAAAIYVVARLMRAPHAEALERAVMMAQGGEFAFVLFALSGREGLASSGLQQQLTIVVVLSMMLTPLLAAFGVRLAPGIARRTEVTDDSLPQVTGLRDHVIIAGYGRIGAAVADRMAQAGIPWVAADSDPHHVNRARRAGQCALTAGARTGQAVVHNFWEIIADRRQPQAAAGERRACLLILKLLPKRKVRQKIADRRQHLAGESSRARHLVRGIIFVFLERDEARQAHRSTHGVQGQIQHFPQRQRFVRAGAHLDHFTGLETLAGAGSADGAEADESTFDHADAPAGA